MEIAGNSRDVEMGLLLEGVRHRFGWDFREYAKESLERRIDNFIQEEKIRNISHLQECLFHHEGVVDKFISSISVPVTSMFRNPSFYALFRERIVSLLRTYPYLRIWHAGCATGEEAFSMAILLHEEGLLSKTRIYATDFNEKVLRVAKRGILPMSAMQEATTNYQRMGGKYAFSRYYTAKYDHAKIIGDITDRITFARHNLAMEPSFNEFNVVVCRNVLIYFDGNLQARVHRLFHESLCRFGYLVLGAKESLSFTEIERLYEPVCERERIYRRND